MPPPEVVMFLKKISRYIREIRVKNSTLDNLTILHLDIKLLSDYCAYNHSTFEDNIMHRNNFLSATALSKNTAATLATLESGEVEKLIILKNNSPKAVLVSIDAYEMMEEEMEDLRLAALSLARLHTFKQETALAHKDIMEKFSK